MTSKAVGEDRSTQTPIAAAGEEDQRPSRGENEKKKSCDGFEFEERKRKDGEEGNSW